MSAGDTGEGAELRMQGSERHVSGTEEHSHRPKQGRALAGAGEAGKFAFPWVLGTHTGQARRGR